MTKSLVILSKATSEVAASKDPTRVRQPTVSRRVDGKRSDLRTRGGFFDSLADSFAQNDRKSGIFDSLADSFAQNDRFLVALSY